MYTDNTETFQVHNLPLYSMDNKKRVIPSNKAYFDHSFWRERTDTIKFKFSLNTKISVVFNILIQSKKLKLYNFRSLIYLGLYHVGPYNVHVDTKRKVC